MSQDRPRRPQPSTPDLREEGMTHSWLRAVVLPAAIVLAGCSLPVVPASQPVPAPTATVAMLGDYPWYETVEDLAAESEQVVTVTIGASRYDVSRPIQSDETDPALNPQAGLDPSEIGEDPGLPITVYEATVEVIHLGDLTSGDTVEVERTGGLLDGTRYESNVARLERGATYLLFLSSVPGHPAFALGGDQGVFVPDGKGGFTSVAGDRLSVDSAALAALG